MFRGFTALAPKSVKDAALRHKIEYALADSAPAQVREALALDQPDRIPGGFMLTAPADLGPRLNYLPREARPEHDHFKLTPDKTAIDREILRTRQEEDAAWPALHYLWPLHPVMEWLSDRALNAFGRHTAPVLRLPGRLAGDEHIVLIHGGFPNRRGHVLIQDWIGVRLQGGQVRETLDWPGLQQRLDLRPGKLPNPGRTGDTEALRGLLPVAVTVARAQLMRLKQAFEAERAGHLDAQRRRLAELKARHENQLQRELDLSDQPEAFKARRRDERQHHIDRVFRDYRDWLDNTRATEDEPYLQVAAVFTGDQSEGVSQRSPLNRPKSLSKDTSTAP